MTVLFALDFSFHFSIQRTIWFNSIYYNDGRFIQILRKILCSEKWMLYILTRIRGHKVYAN